jgi:thiaminase
MNFTSTIDEFGRDDSLRKPKTTYTSKLKDKFKSKHWADICDEIEDEIDRICLEQENKQKEKERKEFHLLAQERIALLKKGLYDLEDGEILE